MTPPTGLRAEGLDPAHLAASVRELFRAHEGPPRIGLEVEALPLDVDSRRPVPPEPEAAGGLAVVPALRAWAVERGWQEGRNYAGSPAFLSPDGGTVSFEPGGQIEYASPPHDSLDRLFDDVTGVFEPLAAGLARRGIELVARGVDPFNPLDRARLHVAGERYRRMSAHYERRGPWGRRMMRQTAALHVNVDAPGAPFESWRVANAAAPAMTALFANSPCVEGRASGFRSARAAQWRRLDPTRTGVVPGGDDPAADYLEFALDADAFLLGPEDRPARPFRHRLADADVGDWSRHLSTLFPEVRPRGYLEVRSVDAVPLEAVIVPAALLAGLLFDDATRRLARSTLPAPTPESLEAAGRLGLADAGVAALAGTVFDLALEGLERAGASLAGPRVMERVAGFRRTFTDRGRDPGHGTDDRLIP